MTWSSDRLHPIRGAIFVSKKHIDKVCCYVLFLLVKFGPTG